MLRKGLIAFRLSGHLYFFGLATDALNVRNNNNNNRGNSMVSKPSVVNIYNYWFLEKKLPEKLLYVCIRVRGE